MNAILLVDKPVDLTSAEVVRRVKRRLPKAVKVGHLGTLDPFATGLLPLCLGEATKIAQFLNTADKRYEGIIQLGWATDTGDRTGKRTEVAAPPKLESSDLASVAALFTGELQQRPPMYSALKRDGVPLYKLARRGVEVERALRSVHVEHLELTADDSDQLRFVVACSKGTYIRVLAEDLGAALGSAAHLSELRRTRFGHFTIEQAATLEDWQRGHPGALLGVREALDHLPVVRLDATDACAARQGKAAVLSRLPDGLGSTALLLDPGGEVAAVVVCDLGPWRYGRVLAATQALHGESPVVTPTVE